MLGLKSHTLISFQEGFPPKNGYQWTANYPKLLPNCERLGMHPKLVSSLLECHPQEPDIRDNSMQYIYGWIPQLRVKSKRYIG